MAFGRAFMAALPDQVVENQSKWECLLNVRQRSILSKFSVSADMPTWLSWGLNMEELIGKVSLKKSIQPLFYIRLLLERNLRFSSYNSLHWFIPLLPCSIDFWHLFWYLVKYEVVTLIYLWVWQTVIFWHWQRNVLINKIFRHILKNAQEHSLFDSWGTHQLLKK